MTSDRKRHVHVWINNRFQHASAQNRPIHIRQKGSTFILSKLQLVVNLFDYWTTSVFNFNSSQYNLLWINIWAIIKNSSHTATYKVNQKQLWVNYITVCPRYSKKINKNLFNDNEITTVHVHLAIKIIHYTFTILQWSPAVLNSQEKH